MTDNKDDKKASSKISLRRVFEKILASRVMVLDGAMGTMIQGYELSEQDFHGYRFRDSSRMLRGNNDVLSITRPDVIADIHRRYLEAGADIIETNTFSAQKISQADYGLENYCREMNLMSARLALQEAEKFSTEEKPRFVVGSVGPTNKTASISPDVNDPAARDITYDELLDAYTHQISALVEGGVHGILIETIFDTLNCKAAIDAASRVTAQSGRDVPLMLSVTVSDKAGRTLSGQTLDAFLATVSSYDILSIGLNCSFGAAEMKPFIKQIADKAPCFVSAYPNAGLPNEMGEYSMTAHEMLPMVSEYLDEKLVNIIGGCCGTNDSFIASYAELVKGKSPRKPLEKSINMLLAGLEPLEVTPEVRFVNVGERCNVAGSRKFLRLINEHNYTEALDIARKQVDDGALVIDINMDDGLLDGKTEMCHFLNLIASEPDIAKVPLMIDSSNWDVIEAALKCVQGKCIVNSISLKAGEELFLEHARIIKRFGCAVVVMCFDEQGQATTFERKIEIAERAYRLLVEVVGMNPLDIIFDPNILSVATGIEEHNSYAIDFIRATEWISSNLPGAHVSGGVSNLSFSFRGNNYIREAMHAVFLYHAIKAGMDFGIVNPATKLTYNDIPDDLLKEIEDVILNRNAEAAEVLTATAARLKEESQTVMGQQSAASDAEKWRSENLESRLAHALIKGIGTYLEDDLNEALAVYPRAVDIIEGPLMDGMNTVGAFFGEGKMFLPQVVKTARTMKQAVEILKPYIEEQKNGEETTAGKVVIATVKGDVHDIGKNIVSVVMACNNFKMIDLGVMVPAEKIVETAIEEKADLVCLSGLITPSLDEMVHVATEMQRRGLNIPLLVGGATTSELHVALKIAPVYDGTVVWMKDAAQNVVAANRLMDFNKYIMYTRELENRYQQLREEYNNRKTNLMSFSEAKEHKLNLFD